MGNEIKKSSKLVELIILILYSLGPLMGNVILVLFGILALEFSVIPNAISIAIPSFMFPFAFIQLFSGAISDVKGRLPVILIGLSIFGIGMIIASLSFSLIIFVVAHILAGIGFGFVNPVLIALLTDITPESKISKKLGILGAVANLGVGLGPLIAAQTIIFGWRYIYLIFLILTILGMLTIFILRNKIVSMKIEIGIRIFLTHLVQEIKRLPVILLVISAFLFSHTATAAIIVTSQSFTLVIPEAISGIIIAFFGVMAFIGGFLAGYIIKTKGIKLPLIIGAISLLIGNLILILYGNNSFEALLLTSIGLIFMGYGGGTMMTLIMLYSQVLSKERRGALAGLTTAFLFIGIAFVPTTFNPIFNFGGISLTYFIILIISISLIIFLIMLNKFGKNK